MSLDLHPDIERVIISREDIQAKVRELAGHISRDYAGKRPVLVGVLRGCVLFMSDLLQNIKTDCSVDFLCVSSYNGGKKTSGVVRMLLDLRENIEGKHVILVEDIVDTGLTMDYLLANLATRNPKSLEVCALLSKSAGRSKTIPIQYKGFDIPDEFVVGYGLDYREIHRNLPYVGILKKSAIGK